MTLTELQTGLEGLLHTCPYVCCPKDAKHWFKIQHNIAQRVLHEHYTMLSITGTVTGILQEMSKLNFWGEAKPCENWSYQPLVWINLIGSHTTLGEESLEVELVDRLSVHFVFVFLLLSSGWVQIASHILLPDWLWNTLGHGGGYERHYIFVSLTGLQTEWCWWLTWCTAEVKF